VWQCSVRDEGAGIDLASQDRMFQLFQQVDGDETVEWCADEAVDWRPKTDDRA